MESNLPLISIVVPSYNRSSLIQETLDSIICQTFPYWEAIVVDDESVDNTEEIITSYSRKDNRIRFLKRDRSPKGANCCRNIGVEQSSGKYLIFLDSDDLLAPFCLEQRLRVIEEEPNLAFWVFPQLLFKSTPYDTNLLVNIETEEDDFSRFLRLDTVWLTSQPIWKKEAFLQIGKFDETLMCWQDLEIDLKAFEHELDYKKYFHLKPDCFLRTEHTDRITSGSLKSRYVDSKIKVIELACRIIQQQEKNELMQPLKVLLTSIVLNAQKNGEYSVSEELTDFGRDRKVYNSYDYFLLKKFNKLHQLKLNKIRGFYRFYKLLDRKLFKSNLNWAKNHYQQ